jgi:hypothetical protein
MSFINLRTSGGIQSRSNKRSVSTSWAETVETLYRKFNADNKSREGVSCRFEGIADVKRVVKQMLAAGFTADPVVGPRMRG